MFRLGWFATGRGTGSQGLLKSAYDAIQSAELNAEIAFVFCNRGPGEAGPTDVFLKQVDEYDIPLVTFSYRDFKRKYGSKVNPNALPQWRLDYDREVMQRLDGFDVDLCVLAGYMLVTGPELCRKYKMINLHPAAPDGPKGTWQQVIDHLIDTKAKSTGVMMHLVTPELDRGPVVSYCAFSIRGRGFDTHWKKLDDLPKDSAGYRKAREALFNRIRQHGVKREHPLVIATIKAFAAGKVKVADGKVVDARGKALKGYDLTREIDAKL